MLWFNGNIALFAGLTNVGRQGGPRRAVAFVVLIKMWSAGNAPLTCRARSGFPSRLKSPATMSPPAARFWRCGIVQHERLEGAIAIAFQDLYHALEPPSQTDGEVLAAIAIVVRDRLVLRDADRGSVMIAARGTCRRRCRSGSRYCFHSGRPPPPGPGCHLG